MRKHHNTETALELANRFIMVAQTPDLTIGHRRRVVVDLLRANFGDQVVVAPVQAKPRYLREGIFVRTEKLVEAVAYFDELFQLIVDTARGTHGTVEQSVHLQPSRVDVVFVTEGAVHFRFTVPSLREVAKYQTLLMLRAIGIDRVLLCGGSVHHDHDCDRVLIKEGKRKFCSVTCQKRYQMKRWREENPSPRSRRGGQKK